MFVMIIFIGITQLILFVFLSDSFVNSQEWTLSRGVPDIRLGIVGSLSSGKSALVHRYLTGSYMQEESPEGGRFKKEVVVDGHSYLLLIRDEGGPPELQVCFEILITYLSVKLLHHFMLYIVCFNKIDYSLLTGAIHRNALFVLALKWIATFAAFSTLSTFKLQLTNSP